MSHPQIRTPRTSQESRQGFKCQIWSTRLDRRNRSCRGRNDSPTYNRALEHAERPHRQARLAIAA
jgi:hypothetical protein